MGKDARIMLAGTASGSGKTTIMCGLLQVLAERGLKIAALKCGPDYIDPMFHRTVVGTKGQRIKTCNIDTFFTDAETTKSLAAKVSQDADISVLEGVMGYYDGSSAESTEASSYAVAGLLQVPVVLVVNCKGASLSVVAMIKGFVGYKKESHIKGVILNQIAPSIYPVIKAQIEQELNISVFGYVPFTQDFLLQSRHLGLVMPEEVNKIQKKLHDFAKVLETTLAIDQIISLANTAEPIIYQEAAIKKLTAKVRIGVARDEAFCFYYEENISLLEEMGAQIIPFSPIKDQELPEDLQGLLLGGGYPELYAKELSGNKSMRESIKTALEHGLACIAECGGFLYLQEMLEDEQGENYPMTGYFRETGFPAKKRRRFGYITLTMGEDSILGKAGTRLPAHEFHYWESSNPGQMAVAQKPDGIRSWNCIHNSRRVLAGFPHYYFYGNTEAAYQFLTACSNHQ